MKMRLRLVENARVLLETVLDSSDGVEVDLATKLVITKVETTMRAWVLGTDYGSRPRLALEFDPY